MHKQHTVAHFRTNRCFEQRNVPALGWMFCPMLWLWLKYMFLDVLLVWKQSKTSRSVSSPTKTVGCDTFSEAAMVVCTINRSASAVACSV